MKCIDTLNFDTCLSVYISNLSNIVANTDQSQIYEEFITFIGVILYIFISIFMEYTNIDEKDLVELYGGSDNEMVDKMMGLMLEHTFPKIIGFLEDNKEDDLASKVEFLKSFASSFNMVGLSVISVKAELLGERIKNNTDEPLVLEDAYSNLERSIYLGHTLIEEYKEKMNSNRSV